MIMLCFSFCLESLDSYDEDDVLDDMESSLTAPVTYHDYPAANSDKPPPRPPVRYFKINKLLQSRYNSVDYPLELCYIVLPNTTQYFLV